MFIDSISGRKIDIIKIVIEVNSDVTHIIMEFICNNIRMQLAYKRVSCLKINSEDSLFTVQGFEIIDHSVDGWDTEQRYEIRDYENDIIHFYCEEILDNKNN